MTHIFLSFVAVLFGFLALYTPAAAQDCGVDSEVILNFNEPYLGSFNVWDTIEGDMDVVEGFRSAYMMDSTHVFAAGEKVFKGDDAKTVLFIAEVKPNGRIRWDKTHEVAGLVNVVQVLPVDDGSLVVANVHKDTLKAGVWFGVFDQSGALKRQKILKKRGYDLSAHDIVDLQNGRFLLAAAQKEHAEAMVSSALYILNDKFGVVENRSILTGFENAILDLELLQDGQILGTGFMKTVLGNRAGWAMLLRGDATFVWQQQYPRGFGAQLEAGKEFLSNTLIVGGTALPNTETVNRAGWLMAIDRSSGVVGWQRYFTGAFGFVGKDLMISKDGLISFLMDGEPPLNEDNIPLDEKEHARILTLNPRGALFRSDEYFNGDGVDVHELVEGPLFQRILVGSSDIVYTIENSPDEILAGEEAVPETIISQDAWLAAAVAMEPYDDPCVIKPRALK